MRPEYPASRHLGRDPDFHPERVAVEFRLTFDGCLMSTGNGSKPRHVHEVRRQFHPQLKRFWQVNRFLQECRTDYLSFVPAAVIGEFEFQPLIGEKSQLLVGIEVLFLRAGIQGAVVNNGDLDGRLKTLFDALAVPQHSQQLGSESPTEDERPFYCLAQDDRLFTHVDIETDELLQETKAGIDRNAARAIVTVRLAPNSNLGFGRLL